MENAFYLYYPNEEGKRGKSYDSIFDLIGHKEPDQTKALGYVLSKSDAAIKAFLNILEESSADAKKIICDNLGLRKRKDSINPRIVDCELVQRDGLKSDRADIVIRFINSKLAIFIEAKSAASSMGSEGACEQVERYKKHFANFEHHTIITVTLTNYTTYNQSEGAVSIRWFDIINEFTNIKDNDFIVKDYVKYLLKINNVMKYYDIEVLSIPAQAETTKTAIERSDIAIYSCNTRTSSRAKHKPLYMAFRQKQGEVRKLYKIDEVIIVTFRNNTIVNEEAIPDNIRERLRNYLKIKKDLNEEAYVFLINHEESIDLPYRVIYERNNSNTDTRPLKFYFAPREEGKDYVLFKTKNSSKDEI